MMVSRAENNISRSLRAVLAALPDGVDIPQSEQFRLALSALEYFIPEVIGEIHSEMLEQSGDAVLPIVARKTGDGEAEMLGHFCFIQDQTLTPFHLKLQVACDSDQISWLELRLGERGEYGMVRTPYSLPRATKLLQALSGSKPRFDWVYEVTYGQPRLRSAE
jgi:hypothetical protein